MGNSSQEELRRNMREKGKAMGDPMGGGSSEET